MAFVDHVPLALLHILPGDTLIAFFPDRLFMMFVHQLWKTAVVSPVRAKGRPAYCPV